MKVADSRPDGVRNFCKLQHSSLQDEIPELSHIFPVKSKPVKKLLNTSVYSQVARRQLSYQSVVSCLGVNVDHRRTEPSLRTTPEVLNNKQRGKQNRHTRPAATVQRVQEVINVLTDLSAHDAVQGLANETGDVQTSVAGCIALWPSALVGLKQHSTSPLYWLPAPDQRLDVQGLDHVCKITRTCP